MAITSHISQLPVLSEPTDVQLCAFFLSASTIYCCCLLMCYHQWDGRGRGISILLLYFIYGMPMAQTLFRKSKAEFRICLAPPGTSYRQTVNLAHMAHSWPLCGYWTPCPRFPRWTMDNPPNTTHTQVILTHPMYVLSFVSNVLCPLCPMWCN